MPDVVVFREAAVDCGRYSSGFSVPGMAMIARCLPALFVVPVLASAQVATLSISAAPECAGCSIEAVRIFTVGPIPGAAPGRDSHIARDSAGRYLLVVEPGPRVAVLDSVGTFIEFVDWKSTRQDTTSRNVTVRIDRDGWTQIFDGVSWTRRQPDGGGWRIGLLDDYRVVGTAAVGAPVMITRPALTPHRVFATLRARWNPADPGPFGPLSAESQKLATTAQQFAVDSVISSPLCRECDDLVLDVAFGLAKAALFAATADRYRIDLFYNWGKVFAQSIEVTDGWLALGKPSAYAPGRTLPEAPRLTGLIFDNHSCTYASVFSRNRPPGTPARDTPCERRLWVAGLTFADTAARDESRRYATVVDVIGATAWLGPRPEELFSAARVISRTRLPGRVELFGPGLAYEHRQLSNGGWAIDVYRLAVRER